MLPLQGAWVRSLHKKLGSHMLCGQKLKQTNNNNKKQVLLKKKKAQIKKEKYVTKKPL